jgi:hypothetical protein
MLTMLPQLARVVMQRYFSVFANVRRSSSTPRPVVARQPEREVARGRVLKFVAGMAAKGRTPRMGT